MLFQGMVMEFKHKTVIFLQGGEMQAGFHHWDLISGVMF